jgi:hypothetical protein
MDYVKSFDSLIRKENWIILKRNFTIFDSSDCKSIQVTKIKLDLGSKLIENLIVTKHGVRQVCGLPPVLS